MNDAKRWVTAMRWAAPTLMMLGQLTAGCAAPEPEPPNEAVAVVVDAKGRDTVHPKDWCPSGDPFCWEVTVTPDPDPLPPLPDPVDPGDWQPSGGGGGGGGDDPGPPPEQTTTTHDYSGEASALRPIADEDALKRDARARAKQICEASVTWSTNGVSHCEAGNYIWGNRLVHTTEQTSCSIGYVYETCTSTITITTQTVP